MVPAEALCRYTVTSLGRSPSIGPGRQRPGCLPGAARVHLAQPSAMDRDEASSAAKIARSHRNAVDGLTLAGRNSNVDRRHRPTLTARK
jgi:hypothetical protein